MLIAFSGAQSSGKSTLLELCKDIKELKSYTFVEEVTRRIKRDKKVPINNTAKNYDETQRLIISDHITNSNLHNAVLDRCFMDGFVYTQYFYNQKKVSKSILEYAREAYYNGFGNYDVIFYTDPTIPLVDDGVRSIDAGFRTDIVDLFEQEIDAMHMYAGVPIVTVAGTVKQRLKTINNWLENNKNKL